MSRPENVTAPVRGLLTALREKVIPWTRAGNLYLLVAQPPLQFSAAIDVLPLALPLLKSGSKSNPLALSYAAMHWPERGLMEIPSLNLAFVIEGDADFQIGITEQMLKRDAQLDPRYGSYVLRTPERSLLVIPPYIPRSDGMHPHWECGAIPATQARSRILWLGLMPEGVMIHICRTEGESHQAFSRQFVFDNQLTAISDLLLRQLQTPNGPVEIANLHLLALLLRIEHALADGLATPDESGLHIACSSRANVALPLAREDANVAIVDRACTYIEAQLTKPLTAEQVAANSFCSVSHLNRLFQTELNTSVMNFVTKRRMETAQSLLNNTSLPISAISQHLGYRHVTHFSLVFKRTLGISPSEHRQQQRRKKPHKIR